MSFTDLRNRLNANFASAMQERVLFETDINKDELWALYLDSFPGNTNPIYRVRREFDCSCCRHSAGRIRRPTDAKWTRRESIPGYST